MRSDVIVHNVLHDTQPGPIYNVEPSWSSRPSPRINCSPRKPSLLQAGPPRKMQSPGPCDYQAASSWHNADWDKKAKFTALSPRISSLSASGSSNRLCRGDVFLHDLEC